MLLSKRKFTSISGTTNILVYFRPNRECYAETEMGEVD